MTKKKKEAKKDGVVVLKVCSDMWIDQSDNDDWFYDPVALEEDKLYRSVATDALNILRSYKSLYKGIISWWTNIVSVEGEHLIYLAKVGTTPVGLAIIRGRYSYENKWGATVSRSTKICHLSVPEEHRGKGYGRLLWNKIKESDDVRKFSGGHIYFTVSEPSWETAKHLIVPDNFLPIGDANSKYRGIKRGEEWVFSNDEWLAHLRKTKKKK